LLPRITHLTIHSSQSNDSKLKNQKLKSHELPTLCHIFSYIKNEMGDRERKKKEIKRKKERNKKERKETEEMKNQNPTILTLNGHNF
jgi:hypothetical protein